MLPKKSALDYFREAQATKPGMFPQPSMGGPIGSPASQSRIDMGFAPSPRSSMEQMPGQGMFGPQAFQGGPFAGAPQATPPNPTYAAGPQAARATGAAAAAPLPPSRPFDLGQAMATQAAPQAEAGGQADTSNDNNPFDRSIPESGRIAGNETEGGPKPPGQGFADLVSGLFGGGDKATPPGGAGAPFGGAGGMTAANSPVANIGQLLKLFGIGF